MSRNGRSAIGRFTQITACPCAGRSGRGCRSRPPRRRVALAARRPSRRSHRSLACSDRPVTTRCTRSWTSSCSSTTPASSFVPPRSTPITLRLLGEGAATCGLYAGARRQADAPSPVEPLTASATGAPLPMPDDKPEYRVYRSRPGFLNRLFNRRDAGALRAAGAGPRARAVRRTGPRRGPPAPDAPRRGARPIRRRPPSRPARALVAADHLEAGGRRRARLHRVLAGAQPRALHDQRPDQSDKVSDGVKAALDDGGNMLTSANNILVLGSDRRPGERGAAAPTRSC